MSSKRDRSLPTGRRALFLAASLFIWLMGASAGAAPTPSAPESPAPVPTDATNADSRAPIVQVAAASTGATLRADATRSLEDVRSGSLLLKTETGGRYLEAPLVDTDVEMHVSGLINRVTLSQRFYNPAPIAVEATYAFPLPENAAVDHLRLQVGSRFLEGQVKERQEAAQLYEAAKAEGKKAALLEQERPNLFTSSVAHIASGETVVVQLEYQQILRYDEGRFSLTFPTVVAPRFIPGAPIPAHGDSSGWALPTQEVPDAHRITPPVLPRNTGLEPTFTLRIYLAAGVPLARIYSSSHVITQGSSPEGVTVSLKEGQAVADRDFVLNWEPLAGTAPTAGLFQETLEGLTYQLLMIMPPAASAPVTIPPRDVIFVLDRSGSMDGPSILQARDALLMALSRLRPQDRFNVLAFNDGLTILFARPQDATENNLSEARRFVSSLSADGGTMMLPAISAALGGQDREGRIRQIVFTTDGAVGNEAELLQAIDANLGRSRLFTIGIGSAPNAFFMRKAAEIGRGTYTCIRSLEEVQSKMSELFIRLERPVLTDLEVVGDDLQSGDIWPEIIPDLYAGEPVVVAVRRRQLTRPLALRGDLAGQPWEAVMPSSVGAEASGVGVLWARSRIESLMDALYTGGPREALEAEVIATALEHHLVSQYTSLVAVDVTPTQPAGTVTPTVPVALALPAGWNFDKVFGKMPESRPMIQDTTGLLEATDLGEGGCASDGKPKGGEEIRTLSSIPSGATPAMLSLLIGLGSLLSGLGLRRLGRGRPV